jgi:hypothetical protein
MYIGPTPVPWERIFFCASENFDDHAMDAIQGLFPAESENIRMVNHSGLFHSFPDFDLVCIHWSAVGAIFPGHGRAGDVD